MKVFIATKNQGKIEGAKRALSKYFDVFDIEGITANSDVGDQPVNEDILIGAKNRVKNLKSYCKSQGIKADLYLSIESGLIDLYGIWMNTNIAVIEDDYGFESYGTSPSFPVPYHLVEDIKRTDLNQVVSKLFYEDKERHNHGGTIQLLTKDRVSRIDLNESAFVMALTKYINRNWR